MMNELNELVLGSPVFAICSGVIWLVACVVLGHRAAVEHRKLREWEASRGIDLDEVERWQDKVVIMPGVSHRARRVRGWEVVRRRPSGCFDVKWEEWGGPSVSEIPPEAVLCRKVRPGWELEGFAQESGMVIFKRPPEAEDLAPLNLQVLSYPYREEVSK